MFTLVFCVLTCLFVFTNVYHCLFVFTYVHHSFLVYVYLCSCLPMFTTVYLCLHMFTTVFSSMFTFVGLAAFYAWARTKHFGCHSVILSVCLSVIMGIHFQAFKLKTLRALQPLVFLNWWKKLLYHTFVSREPRKVQKVKEVRRSVYWT